MGNGGFIWIPYIYQVLVISMVLAVAIAILDWMFSIAFDWYGSFV